jgi:hypothetical protein
MIFWSRRTNGLDPAQVARTYEIDDRGTSEKPPIFEAADVRQAG